ncbi:MAG: radical SAM family heme chaperone HemW [Bacilli bacterium]|nr:radical SAM family heme chaperone HemW [Bacilli bacterium]
MLGVYIHIPFCKNICNYCDFCKVYYKTGYVSRYLDSLELEIKTRYNGEDIDTIYIGGGTPSSLSLEELKRLFDIIKIFKLKDNYEFTIECNIESIDEDKLKLFKDNGVNRLSFGVESFSEDILNILGRYHDSEMIFKNIELSKKYFDNINIDLIYGVTNDIEVVKKDIDNFLKLDISHVSCYSLILEENTKLYIDKHKYIDQDIDKIMFDYINDILVKNGYNHYEISNYAKDGMISIHNKNYWLNGYYYGFGLGSVSYIDNYRISNTKNMSKYLNDDYENNREYEDKNTRKENDLILGFRLIDGIDINLFNKKYNDDLLEKDIIKTLINDNKLEIDNGYLKCNYKYIYLLNDILVNIIGSRL